MIQEIHIENYQSHKDTTIELSPGVNMITGPSDSGKTAIVRALQKLNWNRPTGDNFCSTWGGKTKIEVLADDAYVGYTKDGNESEYLLGDKVFKAFGTTVPDEIQKALNLTEINVQQQLDSPFLLTESAGTVAQHFNKLAKIDKIDSTRKNIESNIRSIQSEIEHTKNDIKKLEVKLSEYPDLIKIENELELLEELNLQLTTYSNSKQKLITVLKQVKSVKKQIKAASNIIQYEKQVNKILNLFEKKNELKQLKRDLESLVNNLTVIDKNIKKQSNIVKLENIVTDLINKLADKAKFIAEFKALTTIIGNIAAVNKKLLKTQENTLKLQQQFRKNFPDICPLCGTSKIYIKL